MAPSSAPKWPSNSRWARCRAPRRPLHGALSDREFEVFRLLVSGESVSDIALRLNLSVKTVSTHKANILRKMNMATAGDLIRYAIAHRLVEGSDD